MMQVQMQALKNIGKRLGISGKNRDLSFLMNMLSTSTMILFVAFIASSLAATIVLVIFSGGSAKKHVTAAQDFDHPRIEKLTNYRDFRKAVLDRNIFNSEGAVPEEADPSEGQSNTFNPNDKCQKPTVNVELLGIIATGNQETTLATMQEKGYTIADVYHSGERIIGNDKALIYSIEEDKVVLNNNGVKECLELNTVKVMAQAAGVVGATAASAATPAAAEGGGEACPSGSVGLESSYVEESLGPGFSKILEAGRLVPFHRDNAMVGFKLIGVRAGSLWTRANLGSGDVITAVNGVSMAQPEKGFALYEALQSDKAIRVEFLKSGKSPCIVNVDIK